MNSITRLFDRRAGYIAAAFAVLLAAVLPSLVFAAQVTERSIQLSSSSVLATGVTYKVNFKSVEAAGAFVVDFCRNSPTIGTACVAPVGFDLTTPTSATSGFTTVSALTANTLRVTGTVATNTAISVDVAGITNPTDAGPIYARIVTYDTAVNANLYDSEDIDLEAGGVKDSGSVAMSITPTIGVSGAVLETMTFCVSGIAISETCTLTSPPTLKLGETVGDIVALDAEHVSTGNIYTQISTNAVTGAVVSLKSGTTCGGMKRVGATVCDIAPALQTGIAVNQAKFGVRTATATDTGSNANGTLQPVLDSGYNDTTYALNYLANNASGVTSAFGDPFLDTDGGPANNKNMALTFGASITNDTPAGLYSTNLSLIATGKF